MHFDWYVLTCNKHVVIFELHLFYSIQKLRLDTYGLNELTNFLISKLEIRIRTLELVLNLFDIPDSSYLLIFNYIQYHASRLLFRRF